MKAAWPAGGGLGGGWQRLIIYRHSSNIQRLRLGTENVFRLSQVLKNLAIIGGGSWGTALAIVLAPRFLRVQLWVYEADSAGRMAAERE